MQAATLALPYPTARPRDGMALSGETALPALQTTLPLHRPLPGAGDAVPLTTDAAHAVLGLGPGADWELVDLAYRHQVDAARAALGEGPALAARLEALCRARRLLREAAYPNGQSSPAAASRPAALSEPRARLMQTLRTAVIAVRRGGHAAAAQPMVGPVSDDPYHLLCVSPAADGALVLLAYRHALRAAITRADPDLAETLELAYARIAVMAA